MNNNNSNTNYFNNGSEYRYLEKGITAIPVYRINKKSLVECNQCQNKAIPEETFLKWKEIGLFDKDLVINSGIAYREKNKGTIFSTTIELLMTVTGNRDGICILSMSIANNITQLPFD